MTKTKKIDVRCQVSELDRASGLVRRRKLARLCEEEDDDDDDYCGDFDDGPLTRIRERKNPTDDFRMFIRSQATGGGFSRRLMEIRQDSGAASCSSSSCSSLNSTTRRHQSARKKSRECLDELEAQEADAACNEDKSIRCYELFCVHQQSLLVHRDQVLMEAERLAKRLSSSTLLA